MEHQIYNYKFSEEDFNKISQLDRIEYRQREDRIEKNYNTSYVNVVIWTFDYLFAFLLIIAVAGYGSFGRKFFIAMVSIIFLIIWYFALALVVALVVDFILLKRKRKDMKALKDSYFKIEVNKK